MSELMRYIASTGHEGISNARLLKRERKRNYCATEKGKREKRDGQKRTDYRLKLACLRAYSGGHPVCACCGECDDRFLTLDHINNDGWQHRQSLKGKTRLYLHLKNSGFPNDPPLQVYCFNCNFGKRVNRGVCPHQSPSRRHRHE